VAINYGLPLNTVRRDVIATWKHLGLPDTIELILMVLFAFAMRRHFVLLASVYGNLVKTPALFFVIWYRPSFVDNRHKISIKV